MKFSIVTPLYNKENFIAETIESVLAQTYSDYELIIVNDSSTDRSLEVVNSFVDERIIVYTKINGGVSAARNFGIKMAKGDIICFLDADDIWAPNYLAELDNTIRMFPSVSFYCCAWNMFNNTPSNVIARKTLHGCQEGQRIQIDYIHESAKAFGSVAITSAVAVKRNLLKKLDYVFDEKYCIGEDNDLWVRCCMHTQAAYYNNPLMLYRGFSEGGLTKSHTKSENIVDYTKWYSLGSDSHLWEYATKMLYFTSKKLYLEGDYVNAKRKLASIRGNHLQWRRLIMHIFIILKIHTNGK